MATRKKRDTEAAEAAAEQYGADSLTVLKGLDAVRKRPGMYIGSTDSRGLMHLIWEIVDNSVDEAAAGHCDRIDVIAHADGSFEVRDNGRGIPVDIEKSTGKSGLELIFTELHAGGKFGGGSYAASGGLHGVGASVVNALSEKLVSQVDRGGVTWQIDFYRGEAGEFTGDKFKPASGVRKVGKAQDTGTRVQWWPDAQIFDPEARIDMEEVRNRMRQIAYLVPGLTITFTTVDGQTEEFHSDDGLSDFCDFLSHGENVCNIIRLSGEGNYTETIPVLDADGQLRPTEVERTMGVEVAMRWTAGWDATIKSFVNTVVTPKGGSHVTGYERALTRVVNEALRETKVLKDKDDNVTKDDCQEGLVAVVKVTIVEPQFEGQTKEILGTPAAQSIVYQVVSEGLRNWMTNNSKKTAGRAVLQKVSNAARARLAARLQRETVRRKNAIESSALPAKLADCRTHDLERSELLLIEGDSAGGSAKGARDSEFQALLPLRGKILNVAKASPKQVLDNAEVTALIAALGAGSGKTFDTSSLRYGRLIFMSVAHDETVLIRDSKGHLSLRSIGDVVDTNLAEGIEVPDIETASLDTEGASAGAAPIKKVIRHHYQGEMLRITTAYGRQLSITAGHSVFTWENGMFHVIPSDELEVGMQVVAPRQLPRNNRPQVEIDLLAGIRRLDWPVIRVEGDTVAAIHNDEIDDRFRDRRVHMDSVTLRSLVAARKASDLSGKDMAERIGVHSSTLCGFEKGRQSLSEHRFSAYLEALGLEWPKGAELSTSMVERWAGQASANERFRRTGIAGWLHEMDDAQVARLGRDVELYSRAHRDQAFGRFVPITEALCEFLGWFMAEGNTDGRGRVTLSLGASDDRYLDGVKQLVRQVFDVEARVHIDDKRPNNRQLYFHSTMAVAVLKVLGLDALARDKRVPDLLINVDESCQLAFLAGYYLGDGSKGRLEGSLVESRLTWCTSSEALADSLGYLLGQLGIMASTTEVSAEANQLSTHGHFMVSVSGTSQLRRLRRVWRDAVNADAVTRYIATTQDSALGATVISDTLVALPITSITATEVDEDVYDFSVADHESFVAGSRGGLMAHNTDADVDGSHIRVLLLTLVYHYMRPLLEEGRVYSAMPPLYMIKVSGSKEHHYAYTDAERDQIFAKLEQEGKKVREVQRFKGLGEMDVEQLALTTMDPKTRSLRRISMDDAERAAEMFDILMGNAVEPRRDFIVTNAEGFDTDKLDV